MGDVDLNMLDFRIFSFEIPCFGRRSLRPYQDKGVVKTCQAAAHRLGFAPFLTRVWCSAEEI